MQWALRDSRGGGGRCPPPHSSDPGWCGEHYTEQLGEDASKDPQAPSTHASDWSLYVRECGTRTCSAKPESRDLPVSELPPSPPSLPPTARLPAVVRGRLVPLAFFVSICRAG